MMIAPVLLAVVTFSSIPGSDIDASLDRTLAGQDAAFCSQPAERPRFLDSDICRLARAEGQRCPNLLKACDAPARADRGPSKWSLFRGLGALLDVLFWGVLAVIAVALVVMVSRALVRLRDSRRSRTTPVAGAVPEPMVTAERVVGETDVGRLLALADELAAAARFEEAIAAAYAALVRFLGLAGLITIHATRTNGDHLRDLRGRPELERPVREAFRGVETVQFGRRPATRAHYAALIERVLPIVRGGVTLCLVLVALQVLTGCGGLGNGDGGESGYSVLITLLSEHGTKVRRRLHTSAHVDESVGGILVLGDQSPETARELLDWADDGGDLFVVDPDDELLHAARLKTSRVCTEKLALDARYELPGLRLAATRSRAIELPAPKAKPKAKTTPKFKPKPKPKSKDQNSDTDTDAEADTDTDTDAAHDDAAPDVIVRCGKLAYVATTPFGEGSITVFADDGFLRNASLSVGDNAYVAVGLLHQPGGVLELVGPWTGSGASSPFSSLRKAGLGPVILELLAFVLLVAWYRGAAFGTRRDPRTLPRRAFVDHVRALGASYARARASRFAFGVYGAWAMDRLRERLSAGRSVGFIELSGAAAARAGLSEATVVRMFAEAREAQEDGDGRAPSDFAKLEELEKLVSRAGGFR